MCLSFFGCQRTPEEKWYYHVLDSLGRIEAPLTIDTLLINTQLNGRDKMDTIVGDMIIDQYRDLYSHDYVLYLRHKDSLIVNKYEYNHENGKLISWSRFFTIKREILESATRVDYTKWYDEKGKIKHFGRGEMGFNPFPLPKFTIHKLIEKLRAEDVDLQNNVLIGERYAQPKKIIFEFDGISYYKENWEVAVVDYEYSPSGRFVTAYAQWRELDSETGEVVREWSDWWGYE
jgi:hypothetical protein